MIDLPKFQSPVDDAILWRVGLCAKDKPKVYSNRKKENQTSSMDRHVVPIHFEDLEFGRLNFESP